MRIRRWAALVMVAALAGCGPTPQAKFDKFIQMCRGDIPAARGNYVARAQCLRMGADAYFPNDPYWGVFVSGMIALAEKRDKGEITEAEAEFQARKLHLDVFQQAEQTRALQQMELMMLLRR